MMRWIKKLAGTHFAEETDFEAMDSYERLGGRRNRVLWCLGAGNENSETYLGPTPDDADVFATFKSYSISVQEYLLASEDAALWQDRAFAGVLLMLNGDVSGAEIVLDNLPPVRPGTGEAQGQCCEIPGWNILRLLPLEDHIADHRSLIAGSEAETFVREWLAKHRARLTWIHNPENPDNDSYILQP